MFESSFPCMVAQVCGPL